MKPSLLLIGKAAALVAIAVVAWVVYEHGNIFSAYLLQDFVGRSASSMYAVWILSALAGAIAAAALAAYPLALVFRSNVRHAALVVALPFMLVQMYTLFAAAMLGELALMAGVQLFLYPLAMVVAATLMTKRSRLSGNGGEAN